MTNAIHAGLQTGFQALIDAVERGDDLASLQKKQRGILMLAEMARQLSVLDQERADALRVLEQLDIQNTIATVGRLLKLQHQLNDAVVKDLTARLENTTLAVEHIEDAFAKKSIADQKTIDVLKQENQKMKEELDYFVIIYQTSYKGNVLNYRTKIREFDSIDTLVTKIFEETKIHTDHFRLLFAGRQLGYEGLLADYGLKNDGYEYVVYVVPKNWVDWEKLGYRY